jgi:3-hydroxy-9,10-secoandrosta-1,3,5(10)-triene-9,17-dione monooxygenase reductase component
MSVARWHAGVMTVPSASADSAGGDGSARAEPSPARFRQVLGHFATGVTVITTADAEGPAGFACQAFAALSLEPPLVLFCPGRSSLTWRRVERTGHFCANVLSAAQRELARVFGSASTASTPGAPGASGKEKFAGVHWSPSTSGAPVLENVLTWAACTVENVHEAGDHFVVTGRVTELGECLPGEPLLFYRGRYGFPGPAAGPPEIVDTLLAWPSHADWI